MKNKNKNKNREKEKKDEGSLGTEKKGRRRKDGTGKGRENARDEIFICTVGRSQCIYSIPQSGSWPLP